MRVNVTFEVANVAIEVQPDSAYGARHQVWFQDGAGTDRIIGWASSAELRQFAFDVLQAADRLADIERREQMDEIPQTVVDDVTAQLAARSTAWIQAGRMHVTDEVTS